LGTSRTKVKSQDLNQKKPRRSEMSPRIHNLGLPRIGEKRELKFALEKYWKGDMSEKALLETADALQDRLWEVQIQQGQDFLTVGDFSLYDHVLDASFLLGHLPDRFQNLPRQGSALEAYFAAARGITLAQDGQEKRNLPAQALTKWFDTNYHYLVPELEPQTHFSLQKDRLSRTIQRAKGHGHPLKYKVLGPLTYLYLCQDKRKPASLESIMKRKSSELRLVPKLDYLPELLRVFQELFAFLTDQGITWIQVDEPFLVYDDMSQDWIRSFTGAYEILGPQFPLILTSYFDHLGDNLPTFLAAPVSGFHLDYPAHRNELHQIQADLNPQQILSLGVVSGRNVWSSNLLEISEGLEDLSQKLGERLWLAPSADLLHLPWSLSIESLPAALEGRLAFAVERLTELRRLKAQLNGEQPWTPEEKEKYHRIQKAGDAVIKERRQKIADLEEGEFHRVPPQERQRLQQARWGLPNFPTTTIGSFPQTPTIRKLRRLHNTGELTEKSYRLNIQQIIKENIANTGGDRPGCSGSRGTGAIRYGEFFCRRPGGLLAVPGRAGCSPTGAAVSDLR
jgi:5-methyltetrahydropteroyltriglutamate--homocysteine methyltransferase